MSKSYTTPKFKINIAPEIFDLSREDDELTVMMTVKGESTQPERFIKGLSSRKSPWQKDIDNA